ncbi:MAG TPA: hypothetical protein VGM81_07600 [Burkholderiaceae bacterium]
MAVWQFDVTIASSFTEKALSPARTRFAEIALTALFGAPHEMLEGWLFYGDKYGSRVDFIRTDGDGCELSARIDAREEADTFISSIVTIVDSMDCKFFDETGRPIAATEEELRNAIMASDAWRFALDPKSYRPDPAGGSPLGWSR